MLERNLGNWSKKEPHGSFFLLAFSMIESCGRFELIGIGKPSFLDAHSMRRFGLYATLALCICGLPATAEERFERWSLEQPGDFVFALSYKRSISFDDRTATSELIRCGPAYTARRHVDQPTRGDPCFRPKD